MLEAETRERDIATAPGVAGTPLRPQVPAPWSRPAVARGLADAAFTRRLFVLLPFAMIAGLIAYAVLPAEPEPQALLALGIGLAVLVPLLWRSIALPLASLLVAAWIGFCLLPVHGVWFGTTMLMRPAYGLYEGRVDEIVSATPEARRIIVSGLVPIADDRSLDIARARLVVPPEPPLAPGDVIRANLRLAPVPGPIRGSAAAYLWR